MPRGQNRTQTRLMLMAGTILIALLPLYLTAWRDAVYDGALLIIAVAFLADSLFRCIDPENWKGNLNVFFIVATFILIALALLQYGSIANDLRKEKRALNTSLEHQSVDALANFEAEHDQDEKDLPNSSALLY